MYEWRTLTAEQRQEALAARKAAGSPWHSPPHHFEPGTHQYLVSATCYMHAAVIGFSAERMDQMVETLLATARPTCDQVFAWCVLPNHYHFILQTGSVAMLLSDLGRMHGRTSHEWNGQEQRRGRKVWFNAVERELRTDRHLWASINYVHHNPVKHGHVERWTDWPWSSARSFLEQVGREKAAAIWRDYPILGYGETWDK